MSEPKKYPVSEIFFSVQGEGEQSGTPMVFLRLAGCTVGKPFNSTTDKATQFPVWQNECTTYDGRKFPCDTDYRKKLLLTSQQILMEIRKAHPTCNWVSITGGEPLMHDLQELTGFLKGYHYELHLETSGTIASDSLFDVLSDFDHVVVSPKAPFIAEYCELANEIRLLVDEHFDWHKLPKAVKLLPSRVWISPINPTYGIDSANAQRCMAIVQEYPEVRISLQIHKILNVR